MEENPITTCIKFALATDKTRDKAAAELARLQAIEAAARELLDTAGGSGELLDLVMKREKRYRLASALEEKK